MLERGKLNNNESIDYAFGLTHGKYKGLAIVDHGGSDAGYRGDLLRFPNQHFSVACLCNLSINSSQLTRQVADIYLAKELKPEPAKPEEAAAKLTAAQLAAKVGIYYNPDGDVIRRIMLRNDSLRMVQGVAGSGVELRPLSDTRFRPVGLAVEIRFEPVGTGGMRWIDVRDSGAKPAVMLIPLTQVVRFGPPGTAESSWRSQGATGKPPSAPPKDLWLRESPPHLPQLFRKAGRDMTNGCYLSQRDKHSSRL